MAGVNVDGYDVREQPDLIVDLLEPTPISWVRIHSLPSRSLQKNGARGLSYLDGIEHLCRNGYNLIVPIEVGYAENMTVPFSEVDSFIGASYDPAFGATKKIAQIAEDHRANVIFGIENE